MTSARERLAQAQQRAAAERRQDAALAVALWLTTVGTVVCTDVVAVWVVQQLHGGVAVQLMALLAPLMLVLFILATALLLSRP